MKTKTPMRMSLFEKTRRLGEGDLEPFLLCPLLNRGSSGFFLRRYPSLIVCLPGVAHRQERRLGANMNFNEGSVGVKLTSIGVEQFSHIIGYRNSPQKQPRQESFLKINPIRADGIKLRSWHKRLSNEQSIINNGARCHVKIYRSHCLALFDT